MLGPIAKDAATTADPNKIEQQLKNIVDAYNQQMGEWNQEEEKEEPDLEKMENLKENLDILVRKKWFLETIKKEIEQNYSLEELLEHQKEKTDEMMKEILLQDDTINKYIEGITKDEKLLQENIGKPFGIADLEEQVEIDVIIDSEKEFDGEQKINILNEFKTEERDIKIRKVNKEEEEEDMNNFTISGSPKDIYNILEENKNTIRKELTKNENNTVKELVESYKNYVIKAENLVSLSELHENIKNMLEDDEREVSAKLELGVFNFYLKNLQIINNSEQLIHLLTKHINKINVKELFAKRARADAERAGADAEKARVDAERAGADAEKAEGDGDGGFFSGVLSLWGGVDDQKTQDDQITQIIKGNNAYIDKIKNIIANRQKQKETNFNYIENELFGQIGNYHLNKHFEEYMGDETEAPGAYNRYKKYIDKKTRHFLKRPGSSKFLDEQEEMLQTEDFKEKFGTEWKFKLWKDTGDEKDREKIGEMWEVVKKYYKSIYEAESINIQTVGYVNKKGREIAKKYLAILGTEISEERVKKIDELLTTIRNAQNTVFKISNLLSYRLAFKD